jgi:hypothetical protein
MYLEVVKLLMDETGLHICVGELLGLRTRVSLNPEESLQERKNREKYLN